ncbi:MAG TPA: PQQ-binding-like beta-propeller repeat protein [Candidatus Eisenbacteria bacterium]|jgi:outer membrane protein assembly factor BamB
MRLTPRLRHAARAALVFALALPAAPAGTQPAASSWPMFRAGPTRSGFVAAPSIPDTSHVYWIYDSHDSIDQSSPCIGADGAIYLGTRSGRLLALNPNGTLRWAFQAGGPLEYSSPAIASDGTVYVGAMDSTLYAVHSDGTLRWKVRRGSTFRSSPLLLPNDDVVVGNGDNSLYRFSADGVQVWSFATLGNVRSSPAAGPSGDLYFGCFDTRVYALHDAGDLYWSGATGNIIDLSSPAVAADSTILIGGADTFLYAIKPSGGVRWVYSDGANINASAAVRADGVILAPMGSHITALSPGGQRLWRLWVGNAVRSSPAVVADGTVYFGSDDSTFYCVNSDSTLRWRYLVGSRIRTAPAVAADGTVYFGAFDGRVFALRPGPPLAVETTPLHGGLRLAAPAAAHGPVTIRLRVPPGAPAALEAFDVGGRRVSLLWRGRGDGADRSVVWNLMDGAGARLPGGVFLLRLSAAGEAVTRRLAVLP